MGADWLAHKRYVVFSDSVNEYVSLTTQQVLDWTENSRHFAGPMPQAEAEKFVAWLNHKQPTLKGV